MAAERAPVFLVAGGRGSADRRRTRTVLQAALRAAGTARPSVAYVGAATGDAVSFRLMMSSALEQAGAGKISLAPLAGKRADPVKAQQVLENADLVFMSGGDVEVGMQVVEQHGMAQLLRSLHLAGKPFCGISAGSIMLAQQWVRWRDPEDNDSAEPFPCLGIAPVLCDTHGEAEGWEELRALLGLLPPESSGYGIVSGSALVVSPDGSATAIGGEVHCFRRAKHSVEPGKSLLPTGA